MSKRWSYSKKIRLEKIGYKCEICGETNCTLIGHHLLGRKKQYEIPELCEIRCIKDEKRMHKLYPNGNGPKQQRRIAMYFKRA